MPGREYQWYSKLDEEDRAIASGNQLELDLLNEMVDDNRKGATITRVILDLVIVPDTVAQTTFTSYGLAMVNGDALAAGAVPEADVNADRADWVLRGRARNMVSSLSDRAQVFHKEYDLRAQRVLRSEEMTLAIIFDHSSGGGVEVWYMSRVLMKHR